MTPMTPENARRKKENGESMTRFEKILYLRYTSGLGLKEALAQLQKITMIKKGLGQNKISGAVAPDILFLNFGYYYYATRRIYSTL